MALTDMLQKQLELQVDSFGLDPRLLSGEELADFITWNAYALVDELTEAMQEFKWKPWLTEGRGEWVDRDAFIGELVDAWHFMMNLMLAASGGSGLPLLNPDDIAAEFESRYHAKREVNAQRQVLGYTGEKDAAGRALDEPQIVDPLDAAWEAREAQRDAQLKATQDKHIQLQKGNQ